LADLVLGPGQDGKTIQPEGLKASSMNEKQRAMLLDVISEMGGHRSCKRRSCPHGGAESGYQRNLVCPVTVTPGTKHRGLLPDSGAAPRD